MKLDMIYIEFAIMDKFENSLLKLLNVGLSQGQVEFSIKSLGVKLISECSLKSSFLELSNFDLIKAPLISALLELNVNSKNIIDFCSHTGLLSIAMGLKNKNANIFAFESIPLIYSIFTKNIEYNQVKNIQVNKLKPSNKTGLNTFRYLPDESILIPKEQARIYTGLEDLECESITIDFFVEKNHLRSLDFIGGNSTGDELFVLQGAENAIAKFKPIIYLEIQDTNCMEFGYEPDEILKFLKTRGYIVFENPNIDSNRNYKLFLHSKFHQKHIHSEIIYSFTKEYKS